jgi:hypothetical protein
MVCTCMQKFRALQSADICKQIFLYLSSYNFGTRIYFIKVSLIKLTVSSGSRGVQQNLFCIFWIFLQVSTNLGSLKQFLEFKISENELKFAAQCRVESSPWLQRAARAACHARSAGRPAGPRPSGPVQPRMRPARCVRAGVVTTRRPRAGWRGGALTGGPMVASRRQGSRLEHHR